MYDGQPKHKSYTSYRWNDITNLVNNKRNFGIECQRTDETVHFSFDEPDAAKYVWKMCVKQVSVALQNPNRSITYVWFIVVVIV